MFRYTFHFELYGQGWSETLFRNAALGAGDSGLLENYIQKRMNLAATDVHLLDVRASNLDTARDITVLKDPTVLRTGTWAQGGSGTTADPGGATNSEDTFTALLLRLSDGGTNFRSFPMIGLPDYVLQMNIIDPAERPIISGRLNNWIAAMSGCAFGMKAQGAATASGRIVEFAPKEENNQLVALGITGVPPVVGSHIILGAVKGFPDLNRMWRVSSVVPAAGALPAYIYLAGSDKLNTYGPVQGGTWKTPSYTVQTLTSWAISRLTARKTGVPFGTVRGRR